MLTPPIEPMLAAPVDRLPERVPAGQLVYEPKFDGYRALLFVQGDDVFVQSRRGAEITTSFPEIVLAAVSQLAPGTVLDGELAILGAGGALDFAALQRRLGSSGRRSLTLSEEQPATFLAFDLLARDGDDVRGLSLWRRRRELEKLLAGAQPPLQLVPQTGDIAVARQWLAQYSRAAVGLEGVVIKATREPYRSGRRGWQKLRVRNTHDVLLGAVTGTLDHPERLVLGRYDDHGELVVVGGTTELSTRQAADLVPWLKQPRSTHPWPSELPAGRMGRFGGGTVAVTLVQPIVIEVSADQSFEHGKWRHLTRYVRPRPDLLPSEVPAMTSRRTG